MEIHPESQRHVHIESSLNREAVAEEAVRLLKTRNIVHAVKAYNPDTPEGEAAAEFIKFYAEFIHELSQHDIENNITRSDVEIKDLFSHVNMMMKQKDEYLFFSMVVNCSSHYNIIHESIMNKDNNGEEIDVVD